VQVSVARVISGAFICAAFLLGLLSPLTKASKVELASLLEWSGFVLGFSVLFTIKFLAIHRVPPSAIFDIQAARRENPNGPCSREALRTGVRTWVGVGAAGLALSLGQALRHRYGLVEGFSDLASAAGVGCWVSAYAIWIWLKVGGRAPNPSLERP